MRPYLSIKIRKNILSDVFALFRDYLDGGRDVLVGILGIPVLVDVDAIRVRVDIKRVAVEKLLVFIQNTGDLDSIKRKYFSCGSRPLRVMFFGFFNATKDKHGVSKHSFRTLHQPLGGRTLATRILEISATPIREPTCISLLSILLYRKFEKIYKFGANRKRFAPIQGTRKSQVPPDGGTKSQSSQTPWTEAAMPS